MESNEKRTLELRKIQQNEEIIRLLRENNDYLQTLVEETEEEISDEDLGIDNIEEEDEIPTQEDYLESISEKKVQIKKKEDD